MSLLSDCYGLELPVPGGDVGTLASGLEPAAGSFGVPVDGPGCTFSFVVGASGIPAGELTPLSPVLDPWSDGAIVGGFCDVSIFSYVFCANAPVEPIAANAIAAAAVFQTFIRVLLFWTFRLETVPCAAWFLRNQKEKAQGICISSGCAAPTAEPSARSHVQGVMVKVVYEDVSS